MQTREVAGVRVVAVGHKLPQLCPPGAVRKEVAHGAWHWIFQEILGIQTYKPVFN